MKNEVIKGCAGEDHRYASRDGCVTRKCEGGCKIKNKGDCKIKQTTLCQCVGNLCNSEKGIRGDIKVAAILAFCIYNI